MARQGASHLINLFRTSSRDSSADHSTAPTTPEHVSTSKPSKAGKSDALTPSPAKQKAKGAVDDPFPTYSSRADDYAIGAPIGYGASSTVYLAEYLPLELACAVKVIDVDRLSVTNIDRLRRETQLMSLSKHPHVLRVRGEWLQGSKLYIATRLMSSGSLSDVMRYAFPDGFDEVTIATILKQALEGLLYFHRNGWLHRDLKAGNLLVDEDGTVLLADFGVSSVVVASAVGTGGQPASQSRKSFVGTPLYMAPEVIEQRHHDAKADIWSFGITALELSTGSPPRAFIPAAKVLQKTVLEAAPTVREDGENKFSKSFKDLVDSCLRKDPAKRPTSEKLLSHSFFKQAKKKSYLVSAVLTGLPPLQARQDRVRTKSVGSLPMDSSWDFGSASSPTLSRGRDPFASFTGRHAISPPGSPHGSRLLDIGVDPPSPRHGRTISFSVPDPSPPVALDAADPAALVEIIVPPTKEREAVIVQPIDKVKAKRMSKLVGKLGLS